jgi:hypothetical protein
MISSADIGKCGRTARRAPRRACAPQLVRGSYSPSNPRSPPTGTTPAATAPRRPAPRRRRSDMAKSIGSPATRAGRRRRTPLTAVTGCGCRRPSTARPPTARGVSPVVFRKFSSRAPPRTCTDLAAPHWRRSTVRQFSTTTRISSVVSVPSPTVPEWSKPTYTYDPYGRLAGPTGQLQCRRGPGSCAGRRSSPTCSRVGSSAGAPPR